jgi:D-glycero-alpha-D-manno-heptose 1-phosphate guanylyltransferase
MEAIVLAGGLGTRLASRLNGIPKPMAPVAGRPFVEILLGRLRSAGCSRAILSVGHLSGVIQDYFGGAFRGMKIDYAVENAPLGTGGAIRAALGLASEASVLVLNGDTFLDVDYPAMMRFHAAQAVELTMAVSEQADVARYGGVVLAGDRIASFEEKGRSGPGWINAGVYALQTRVIWPEGLPERFSFETDYLAPRVGRLEFAAYRQDGVFLDIGVPEDLDRAQTLLSGFME